MKNILFIILIFIFIQHSNCQNAALFNVQQYGAKGQKNILVTKYIQQAIDQCFKTGGGTVYFPAGDYLTGHLELKDNITLYLEAGATIWASRDSNDYKTNHEIKKSYEGGEMPSGDVPVLIYANKAKNISILGKGSINGRAQRIEAPMKSVDSFTLVETENAKKAGIDLKMFYKVPPFTNMIIFDDCENVTVSDVSLIESTSWTLHFKWCKNVHVQKVTITSSLENGVNADGIDVDGCRDVFIDNCSVKTGDDAIVLKTTRTIDGQTQACENVIVTNCSLVSTDSGLKIGTESFSDFSHIIFSNCIIRNTNRAISIIIRDGATVSDVLYSNINIECNRKYYFWWGNGDPIWLVVLKRKPESKTGMIKNITFRNIMAHAQGTTKIEGFAGKPLENISLTDVQFLMQAEDQPDKRATDAFYAHDISHLSLNHVNVIWDTLKTEPLWRNAFAFENIKGLYLEHLQGNPAPASKNSMIYMNNIENAVIENCNPFDPNAQYLRVDGSNSKNIIITGMLTGNTEKHNILGSKVLPESVVIK